MRKVFESSKPYLIAETAYSFEGDKKYLLKQIINLKGSNVDAIKYHLLFNKDEYIVKEYSLLHGYLKKWILKPDDWKEIIAKSKKSKLDTFVLTDDIESIKFCAENNDLIDAIEVHAACVNDLDILDKALLFAKDYDKVFVIGISGFEFTELSSIIEHIKEFKLENVLLMYGFQNFPTKVEEINLIKIPLIQKAFGYKVGYADHTKFDDPNKEYLIYSSYAIGANVQEIHYVLEEGIERIDYITGISGGRLGLIKERLERMYLSLGKIDFRLNEGEKKYLNFRKVPVYKTNLEKGTILKKEDVTFKRVENPKRQHVFREIDMFFGKRINKRVVADSEVSMDDFE